MMYLTRIFVNDMTAAGKRLVDNYRWHKALWEAFAASGNNDRPFLSRIDRMQNRYLVYLLSETLPEHPEWGEWDTKKISGNFLDNHSYRFQLRANPTVKRVIRDENGERKKNGQRTAIYHTDELNQWIQNKSVKHGFVVKNLDIDPPIRHPFRKKGKSGVHVGVDFRGILSVKDKQLFENAFENGIGPAKAFGFGMLVLQPV